ncbi:AraC family transcriptional regulator [Belliella sp. DSM 111904]|uniref:AraC family transcriptional regulator n=1 Tax=Belliella filtrata TaxID=2923435 RepID=A0ABS9V4K6_9BACT|nr:AraC family transcriptional regulator [Belliella filtrata]MCH7411313.1 AraC family transcriptional regulator [Belliella filtrata]
MDLAQLFSSLFPNFKVLVSIVGAIQGFFLAVIVLFYPLKHRASNRILFFFLLVQAYLLIAIRIAEWVTADLAWIVYSPRLAVFSLLYLYIKSLYEQINWKKEWYHLVLIFIDIAWIRGLVLFKIPIVMETGVNFYQFFGSTFEIIFMIWLLLSMVFYFWLTSKTIKNYQRKAEQNFSDLHQIGVKWVKFIFYGKFLLELTDYLSFHIIFGIFDWYIPYHGILNAILSTAFMYFLTIKGKLNPQIYQLRMVQDLEQDTVFQEEKKSKEVSDELQKIAFQIAQAMDEDKIFLQEGLSVKDLAERLHIQPYLISQAINSSLGKNFFDLVNGFRVEEAKKLILDENLNHLSMIGIAFEAGFSSKTAFNIAFKKFTGMTPSEYKQTAKANQN